MRVAVTALPGPPTHPTPPRLQLGRDLAGNVVLSWFAPSYLLLRGMAFPPTPPSPPPPKLGAQVAPGGACNDQNVGAGNLGALPGSSSGLILETPRINEDCLSCA